MSESSASVENTKDSAPKVSRQFVDLLDEDRPIASQKFTCISFISPENILKDKNLYYFKEFIKNREQTKEIERFPQYLNFLSMKHNLKFDDLMDNFKQFLTSEKTRLMIPLFMMITRISWMNTRKDCKTSSILPMIFRRMCVVSKYAVLFPLWKRLRCLEMLREVDPHHNV